MCLYYYVVCDFPIISSLGTVQEDDLSGKRLRGIEKSCICNRSQVKIIVLFNCKSQPSNVILTRCSSSLLIDKLISSSSPIGFSKKTLIDDIDIVSLETSDENYELYMQPCGHGRYKRYGRTPQMPEVTQDIYKLYKLMKD